MAASKRRRKEDRKPVREAGTPPAHGYEPAWRHMVTLGSDKRRIRRSLPKRFENVYGDQYH